MTDREKVIKGLECCRDCFELDWDVTCATIDCPYKGERECLPKLCSDALALLKEQEAEIEHLKRPGCEYAEHDGTGCLGYSGCTQDDEPIESCKRCEKYTGNVYEAVKWDE